MRPTNFSNKLCILFLLTNAAFVRSAAGQDVKVLTNPQLRTIVDAGKQHSGRPPVLSAAERLQHLQKLPGGRLPKNTFLDSPITLTLANGSVGDRAFLYLTLPALVVPDETGGYASFTDDFFVGLVSNAVIVKLVAPSTGKYLVDFSVMASAADNFTVSQQGSSAAGEVGQVIGKHVLLTVEAKQINQTIVVSLRGKKAWNFYACEISQIKQN